MSSKDYENLDVEEQSTTKEVIDFNELASMKSIEEEFQSAMDENMATSDLLFQDEIEQLEVPEDTMIIEPPFEKKEEGAKTKKEKRSKLKERWNQLSKKKKGIFCVCGILILILIVVLFIFLFSKKEEKPSTNDIPDVILEEDNYRYENGVLHFLDEEEDIGTYECTNKDETLCYVAYLTANDEFDEAKKIDESDESEIERRSKIYKRRYVFVFDNDSKNEKVLKLYDIKDGKVLKDVQQIKAYEKHEDIAVVKNMESNMGVLSFTQTSVDELIPFEYDELGIFSTDENLEKIPVKKSGSYYLINKNNERITKELSSKIVGANQKAVKTKEEQGTYHAYTYDGKELGDGEYIELLDSYLLFVREMQLYVTDYNKNPMNLEGIPLKNNQYVPIATYKNNRLVSTKKSFETEVYDKTLTIRIFDEDESETRTLNLQEGILSATLAYYNYFDGKLYFYRDEAKKELLGTYACNNKNQIENNTNTLDQCTLAKESIYQETRGNNKEKDYSSLLGVLPIFNRRYIFVKDGTDTIVLYDLKESASKAYYKNVDTRSYTKSDKLTFVETNNVYYIGQSERSGKFGVAKITPDNVEVQIEFKYKSIKKLGDYFVIEDDTGYYLSDVGGKILTDAKADAIVDYNKGYLKTFKDNQYKMSGFKEKETKETYDYVELYENYYAVVTKEKDKEQTQLSIFKYGMEEPLETGIELILDRYTGEETKAFRITMNGTKAIIEIGQKDQTYKPYKTIDLAQKETEVMKEIEAQKEEEKKQEENKKEEENTNGNGE